ncbi:putative transcription factor Homobox-WOX family [Medicago truncatula]|uniref:Homeobox associated leucine zipper protein n=1 Tax=Medicago truncatula TaxID=3880 RepID=A0A072UQB3_MEDTR|nr:homeobox-leucine zipper protein HAT22 [Medicago truncatula]KEH31546.1 homeobox associated leucine zipper protein [Medicago truncatula]RHN63079.1 putative transcription factor Homobox-WOX family [Medicago truncatula]
MGLNNQDASNNSGLQLILGLALTLTKQDTPPSNNNVTKPYSSSNHNNYEAEPSLTLGLSTKSYYEEPLDFSTQTNSPHHSVVSSFSSGRVKRERDVSSELEMETTEMERVSSRISDEDEDGATAARKKLRLTKDQSAMLEESFKEHSTLNPKQKQALARELNLTPRQVEVWFQNRRARTKLKQTEVDCEFLKKCCETLTEENRRLQKEVQELKALKLVKPLYMPMPAATLTMCPSCERLGGGGGVNGGSSNKTNFSKPHFYNPFTNSSAAC